MNDKTTFDPVAKTLHWLIAIMVILVLIFGMLMEDLPNPEKAEAIMGHSGIGLLVLILGLVRVYWRRTHEPPALPGGMKPWEAKLSKINTSLLYILIIYQPTMGLLHAATYVDFDVRPFGLFNASALLPSSEAITRIFHIAHSLGSKLLLLVVLLHIIAAFKHLIVDRDRVFQRMFPFMKG